MKVRIIPIGNSHGVRIPKPIRDQIGLGGEAEMSVENNALVIRPVKKTLREQWADVPASACQDDGFPPGEFPPSLTKFDEEEWEW